MRVQIRIATNADSFVGIKIENDLPIVTFPYGINVDVLTNETNNELAKTKIINQHILKLTKTIHHANNYYKNQVKIKDGFKVIEGFPLYDFLWILNDYVDNGLFKTKEKRHIKNSQGKVDWKKTIQGSFTISNNNVVFNNLVHQQNINVDNLITNIHSYCVNEANKLCGWFFGNINTPENHQLIVDKKTAVNALKNRLVNVFDDRTKLLLTRLINVLSDSYSNDPTNNVYEYGTHYYANVWEIIIDKIFNNVDIRQFYPSAKYYMRDGEELSASSKLRPDTMVIREGYALVIDSKYYKYGITADTFDLPPTSDIQKQTVYGEYVDSIIPKIYGARKNIYNAFIIPFDKNSIKFRNQGLTKDIEFAGYARGDWIKDELSHKKISIMLVDSNYALNNFSKFSKEGTIDYLIKKIKDANNKYNY